MLGKRQARGNVAVAALLFVTAIGVGAVALDSARVARNPSAQVAATSATDTTTKTATQKTAATKTKCELGFDYNVRIVSGKATIEKRPDNKCASAVASATNSSDGRICKPKESWTCQVYYCLADKLRPKDSSGKFKDSNNGCRLIPTKSAKYGEEMNADSADIKTFHNQASAEAMTDILKNGSPKDIAEARSAIPELDPGMRGPLTAAFDTKLQEVQREVDQQNEALARAKAERDEIQAKLKSQSESWFPCPAGALAGPTCYSQSDLDAANKKISEQEARLKSLQEQSQALSGSAKTLTPGSSQTTPGAVNCPGGDGCPGGTWSKEKQELTKTTFESPPSSGNPGGGVTSGGNTSGLGGGDLLKTLGQALPLLNSLSNLFGGSGNAPTCTLRASPTNITSPGQTVTLSWTSTNAQSAYLSNSGQVGPSGSIQVQPQGATTYSMQVTGYPQQQQSSQQQGQFVYNPYTSQYQYVPAQQQPSAQGPAQQGQCQVQVTMGQGTGSGDTSTKPKAQISCQPKIADVGMQASISYSCQNANTSSGEGFSTNGQLSGSASTTIASPTLGSTSLTYGVTCSKDGVTDSAQCTVNVNKPSIVLVANPHDIDEGEKTTIGWVTGAMDKCVISSPTLSDFTEENKDSTSVSGSVRTPALTRDTKFVLTCVTKAGSTKSAETTVRVDD